MKESYDNFIHHLAQTSATPLTLEIEKAEGCYIYDTSGKAYIDLISGLAVNNIGHRHPKVIEAAKNQLDQYLHVIPYGEFVQEPQVKLAKTLTDALPETLNNVYFVNSGTEANEAALKLAKRITGRTQIIACHKSYHGSTHGSMSITGNETKKTAFRPLLPDVHFIHFNAEEELSSITKKTACVIIEPVQGDAGVRIPNKNYLKKLRDRCNETGSLLIFDEVQTGFGRTGTLFAFEQFGVVPDILTLAKAMGGGLPIGAFVSSKSNMRELTHNPMLGHITTFGGNPVSCAAALANLQVIQDEKLIEQVHRKGQLFKELLQHPLIKEVRSIGLMFAVEMEDFEKVHQTVLNCLKNGVISFWFLSCNNSFRISPPLTISDDQIRSAVEIILKSMDEVASSS